MADSNQVEHEQISTSLEVEQIDVNLFRSKSLWLPARARGVFGGYVGYTYRTNINPTHLDRSRQVISQALVSATNCVDSGFALHVSKNSFNQKQEAYDNSYTASSHYMYVLRACMCKGKKRLN
jgi:hypothetical protein